MKNYIGFVNDHSGSMSSLAVAAKNDYNTNITAIKNAADREMLDTVVSVVAVGIKDGKGNEVKRQVQVSNPHVLKPIDSWPCPGGTPLYDGIGSMIELLQGLPDADNDDVSFLIMITTDGEEMHSKKYNDRNLRTLIEQVSRSGRWTFAFRVPRGASLSKITALGIPTGNIQEWDTTTAGLQASTVQTVQAMDNYFTTRSTGVKSSSAFYADATKVNTQVLTDPWPRPFNQIEFSGATYGFSFYAKDSVGNVYSIQKSASICRPFGNTPLSKNTYGVADVLLEVKCDSTLKEYPSIIEAVFGIIPVGASQQLQSNPPISSISFIVVNFCMF